MSAPATYDCGECGFHVVDWSDDPEDFDLAVDEHEQLHPAAPTMADGFLIVKVGHSGWCDCLHCHQALARAGAAARASTAISSQAGLAGLRGLLIATDG